jgi:luciferase family oxidoreductase group 1
MTAMKLGVLDIGSPIEDTIELAPLAERLGYARYWIAEHQPQPSPISIAFLVANQTERIRVGTAGVLLHYYPPLRTAHEFHLLERAHTGRIDAGFCGGITPLPVLVEPDRDGRDYPAIMKSYPDRTRLFVRHLRNTRADPSFDPTTAWGGVGDEPPQLWSLGGSVRSASLAAELGLSFGYALMFTNSKDEPEAARAYRDKFVPSRELARPNIAVAVAGVCDETDAAANAAAAKLTNPWFAARVVGSPATCARQLDDYRTRYGADDVIFAELTGNQARSLELLAKAVLA